MQVDAQRAKAVWFALRGGWHYPVGTTGLIGSIPKKNIHSHPGDALSYGAAILFPLGRVGRAATWTDEQQPPSYFGTRPNFQDQDEAFEWAAAQPGRSSRMEDFGRMPEPEIVEQAGRSWVPVSGTPAPAPAAQAMAAFPEAPAPPDPGPSHTAQTIKRSKRLPKAGPVIIP